MKTNFRFAIGMLILMIASITDAYAQNTFFPTKPGMVLLYEQSNAKGKSESYSKLTIKDVEGSNDNMTISYVAEVLNKDRKSANPPVEVPCKVIIKDGVMILDMNQMFSGQMKDSQLKMEVTGVPMELPSDMQPGQSLKDAEMTMSIDMVFTKMKTTMKMTNGKCLAIEDVTVPAGTFKCYKITQTVSTSVMGRSAVSQTISWYAQGIGTVKTETYNDKNQLQSTQQLVEMN